jgi:hypothetical protein
MQARLANGCLLPHLQTVGQAGLRQILRFHASSGCKMAMLTLN